MPASSLVWAASVCLLGIGVFEAVCWATDPFDVHEQMTNKKVHPDTPHFRYSQTAYISACANGLPFVLLAVVLPLASSSTIARVVAHVFFPIFFLFVQMFSCFWTVPYLLGIASGPAIHRLADEHAAELESMPRFLPKIKDHLVPDNEHGTLLLMLVVVVPLACHAMGRQTPRTSKLWLLSGLLSALTMCLPALMVSNINAKVGRPTELQHEVGLLVVWALAAVLFFFTWDSAVTAAPATADSKTKKDK
eukprot:m.33107 g.33107  ORF g.33107 m.33107 type:complete len:249 (+) comp10278_c0_seq1:79-825(+)